MILEVTCNDLSFILNIVKYLFKAIQWGIPIFLIVLITIDVLKAMIAGDEKKTKEAISKAGKRFLYAIIFFFIPYLVKLIFSNVPGASLDCLRQYF